MKCVYQWVIWARIPVQVTICRRLRIDRESHLDHKMYDNTLYEKKTDPVGYQYA